MEFKPVFVNVDLINYLILIMLNLNKKYKESKRLIKRYFNLSQLPYSLFQN